LHRSSSRSHSPDKDKDKKKKSRSADKREDKREDKRKREDSVDARKRTLHVKNLTRNITDKHLEEIFGCYGVVKKVELAVTILGPIFFSHLPRFRLARFLYPHL
jgi:RNA recognition motif-containing protein